MQEENYPDSRMNKGGSPLGELRPNTAPAHYRVTRGSNQGGAQELKQSCHVGDNSAAELQSRARKAGQAHHARYPAWPMHTTDRQQRNKSTGGSPRSCELRAKRAADNNFFGGELREKSRATLDISKTRRKGADGTRTMRHKIKRSKCPDKSRDFGEKGATRRCQSRHSETRPLRGCEESPCTPETTASDTTPRGVRRRPQGRRQRMERMVDYLGAWADRGNGDSELDNSSWLPAQRRSNVRDGSNKWLMATNKGAAAGAGWTGTAQVRRVPHLVLQWTAVRPLHSVVRFELIRELVMLISYQR